MNFSLFIENIELMEDCGNYQIASIFQFIGVDIDLRCSVWFLEQIMQLEKLLKEMKDKPIDEMMCRVISAKFK